MLYKNVPLLTLIAIDCVYHGLCAGKENWLAKEVLDQLYEGKLEIDYKKPCDIQVSVFVIYSSEIQHKYEILLYK